MKNILIALVILLTISVTGWCETEYYKGLEVNVPPRDSTIYTWKDCAGYSQGLNKVVKCNAIFGGTSYLYRGNKLTSDQLDKMVKAENEKRLIEDKQYDRTQNGQVIFSIFIGIGIVIVLWWALKSGTLGRFTSGQSSTTSRSNDLTSMGPGSIAYEHRVNHPKLRCKDCKTVGCKPYVTGESDCPFVRFSQHGNQCLACGSYNTESFN
ncbi:MAG: hypothetical protein WC723_05090 [Candidatus Omnitrophota bacterium]